MKFQPDTLEGVNLISRLQPGELWVHQTVFRSNVIVPWVGQVQAWPPHPASDASDLLVEDFALLLACGAEVALIGTGARQQLIKPALYRALIGARVGVEVMDTAAACRTFNVLASEGRRVLAAVLLA